MPCEGCATKNNKPPIAVAGPDQVITLPADSVLLDGKQSSDPDGIISSYLWTKISGPTSFSIVNVNVVQTQLGNLIEGVYQIELKVTDAGGLFSKDTVQVAVNSTQPNPCAANRPLINVQLRPFGTLFLARSEMAVASAGSKMLFAGGYNGEISPIVDIYDIVTGTWSTTGLSIARHTMGVAVAGNKIFFAGGMEFDFGVQFKRIDIYDASTDSWTIDSLSWPRVSPAGEVIGNKLFFAGGMDAYITTGYGNVVDIKALSTDTWSTSALSEEKAHLSSETIGNKIYFAGGANGYYFSSLSNRIDVYDNSTASWSIQTMLEPKTHLASIGFAGKIYWAGGITGFTQATSHQSALVEIKDITTNTSTQACLFQPNSHFNAVLKNNKIVFFTGEGTVKNKFDIYDPATNVWSVGVLPVEIYQAAIISVNNTIYVAGGYVNGVLSNKVWKLEF